MSDNLDVKKMPVDIKEQQVPQNNNSMSDLLKKYKIPIIILVIIIIVIIFIVWKKRKGKSTCNVDPQPTFVNDQGGI